MNDLYGPLLSLGIQFLMQFLTGLKAAKAPTQVIASVQGAVDSLVEHQNDIISKANLDALRG